MSQAIPASAPAPTPRVLLRPTYRFADWWMRGLGRHAGKILALLPVATIVLLFVWIFLINTVCSLFAHFDTCSTAFSLVSRTGAIAILTLILLCVASLVARLAVRVRGSRQRHRAEEARRELRARIGGTDPLTDARYARLHQEWVRGTPDVNRWRLAVFLIVPALVIPFILLVCFFAAENHFDDYGSLIVYEFTQKATAYFMLELVLITGAVIEYRLWRIQRAVRALARERFEAFETEVGAATAELVRQHQNPGQAAADGPAFTFRAYAARPGGVQQNP